MSNVAELSSSNDPDCSRVGTGSIYLMANHHLPLWWLALYSQDDLRMSDDPDDDVPEFVKPRCEAITVLETRAPALLAGYPLCQGRWLQQFIEHLRSSAGHLSAPQPRGRFGRFGCHLGA